MKKRGGVGSVSDRVFEVAVDGTTIDVESNLEGGGEGDDGPRRSVEEAVLACEFVCINVELREESEASVGVVLVLVALDMGESGVDVGL